MLLELSVSVKGKHRQESDPSIDMNRIIDASGLHYKTTGKGTVLEGSWEAADGGREEMPRRSAEQERSVCDAHEGRGQEVPELAIAFGCSGEELEEVLEDEGEWLML